MIIVETCPKCGADLLHLQICTNPPIPRVECPQCGWSHEEKPQEVVRVPYGGNRSEVQLDGNINAITTTLAL